MRGPDDAARGQNLSPSAAPDGGGASEELQAVRRSAWGFVVLAGATLLAVGVMPLAIAAHLSEAVAWIALGVASFLLAIAESRLIGRGGPARAPLSAMLAGLVSGFAVAVVASTWLAKPQACVFVGMVAMVVAFVLIVLGGYVRITRQVIASFSGLKGVTAAAVVVLMVGAATLPLGVESLLLACLLVAYLLAIAAVASLLAGGSARRALRAFALLGLALFSVRLVLFD